MSEQQREQQREHERAQRRENPDPTEGERPFPKPLMAVVIGLAWRGSSRFRPGKYRTDEILGS